MKIIGADKFEEKLERMSRDMAGEVVKALYAAGQIIEIEAEHSITEGSVSGKHHVPSKPGQPPKADTRVLDTNIETTIEDRENPKVHVTSNAPYSAFLEFGTLKMAERPFMRPALARKRGEAQALVAEAVNRIIRRT